MLYLNSICSYPTGVTTTTERKAEILEVCKHSKTPIIETELFTDLHPNPPPTFMSMDQDNLVIYIGSFSKILPQGLRLGWIISPYSLIDRFYDVQIRHSAPANILTQLIVDELLSTGLYYEYLNSFKKRLEETSVFTSRIMKEHLTDLAQWSGLHPLLYWTRFNKKLSPEFMANNNIIPGTIFDEMSNQYTIISKLLFKEDEFEQRIIFLAEKLKEL